MKPKAIFFDVDGTIIPLDVVVKTFQDCCKHFKVKKISKKKILKNAIGYRLYEVLPKFFPNVNYQEFKNYFEETQIKNFKKYAKLLPFVKSTFLYLRKQGIKIGIITTKTRKEALAILNGYKLPFDTLVSGSDVKNRKPNPESVFKACESLNLEPKDCIFVGDHPFDMLAAKKAGCLAIGILTGWGNKINLKKAGAGYIIKDLSFLKKLINK
ncbi:MAG: HAD-IA family hydrolase [Candidatus Aenigmatarchaeota archaeon]